MLFLPCLPPAPGPSLVGPVLPPPVALRLDPPPVPAAPAGAPWTRTDVALDATFWALFAVDWLQTLEVARHPTWTVALPCSQAVGADGSLINLPPRVVHLDRYTEHNPLLGRHPSVPKVHAYFLAAGLGYVLATRTFLPQWRRGITLTAVSLEALSVNGNIQAGIRIR